jgi:hypothetical protein
LKKAPLELMTGVRVTPPFPITGGVTVSEMVMLWVSAPLVPVMVTANVPVVAVALAAKVMVLLAVAGLGFNVAETPVGRPDALKATLPLNPPVGVMVIVHVVVPP